MSTAVRVALGGIWLWAGIAKIADPDAAARAVRAYQVLPDVVVNPVAWGLPFVELTIAALLVFGVANRIASTLGAGLLTVFITGIAQAWARDLQISCGCFGGGGPAHADAARYATEIGRDLVVLALSGWLIWHPASRLALNIDR
ncbi:MAG: DoxX family membrane protein [Acidimicrobiales bacterium]